MLTPSIHPHNAQGRQDRRRRNWIRESKAASPRPSCPSPSPDLRQLDAEESGRHTGSAAAAPRPTYPTPDTQSKNDGQHLDRPRLVCPAEDARPPRRGGLGGCALMGGLSAVYVSVMCVYVLGGWGEAFEGSGLWMPPVGSSSGWAVRSATRLHAPIDPSPNQHQPTPCPLAPPPPNHTTGVDVLFKRMNLRFCYFFPEVLSAAALKASLAEVGAFGCACMCMYGYVNVCI